MNQTVIAVKKDEKVVNKTFTLHNKADIVVPWNDRIVQFQLNIHF